MIYKILANTVWEETRLSGEFSGSASDIADGFIHFSAADQAAETARRHFTGQVGLVLLAVPATSLGAALKWEPSRSGDLFPHLYGPLACAAVAWTRPLRLDADGIPQIGTLPA